MKALPLALLVLISLCSHAGPISLSDFGQHVQVESFDELSAISGTPFGPLALHGNTYTTSSSQYRVLGPASGGSPECLFGTGTCISTGLNDFEQMDIFLSATSVRAGLWVGGWSFVEDFALSNVDVSFFNAGDELLGTLNYSGPRMGFVAWESLPRQDRISRIRVDDRAPNSRVVVIDNLMWEPRPVPEPPALVLLAVALLTTLYRRRTAGDDLGGRVAF